MCATTRESAHLAQCLYLNGPTTAHPEAMSDMSFEIRLHAVAEPLTSRTHARPTAHQEKEALSRFQDHSLLQAPPYLWSETL